MHTIIMKASCHLLKISPDGRNEKRTEIKCNTPNSKKAITLVSNALILYMPNYVFYVYILSNPSRTVLYIGFTNSLTRRLNQHIENKGTEKSFASKYKCTELVHYETYKYVNNAIAREKELKKWRREKKDALINQHNPRWNSLNGNFMNVEE